MSHSLRALCAFVVLLSALPGFLAYAQSNVITIDATSTPPNPQPVAMPLGSFTSPSGQTLGVNSQHLTRDGKPWLPVMGEFHFSRYPESQWETEILKMKAAGVQIISTYIIWIHHEQSEGVFNWQGQRDLRRFVELCGKHGLYVVPRIGPWAHAEARNGGLPDWVLHNGPTRQNDPTYLKEVQTFYQQIALQLHGLLWKDGGPVIAIQIENEYRERGPGKGEEHIRTLKKMAIEDGLDVPFYTVTGWDGAVIPLDSALPVFGGYPDAPWDGSPKKLPPAEIYAFRFTNRSAGSMGAIGGAGQAPASTYRGTPFLTAEVGDGIEDTYFRRPVVSADDVASIAPIMLGSGANLLGYYLFHGGTNPDGGPITLQESQETGYPTDVPVRSYDFQAPLGEYGQERDSLRKLKLVHYFLEDFGADLAPMVTRPPSAVPADPADTSVPRVSARTLGNAGFLFFNNHVRGLTMPARPGFQIQLKLPSGTLSIPEQPVDLPSSAYGIWPVNLPLFGTKGDVLRYSTAQLFKRVTIANEQYLFFFALPGVRPEFAFPPATELHVSGPNVQQLHTASSLRLLLSPTSSTDIQLRSGTHLVLLPQSMAEQIWQVDDPHLLLASSAFAFSDGSTWTLQSLARNSIDFGVFGSRQPPHSPSVPIRTMPGRDLFNWYTATIPAVDLQPVVTALRPAQPRAPWKLGAPFSWRPQPIAVAPNDVDFKGAAAWKIELPPPPKSASIADEFLTITYQGDAARLYQGDQLVDDNFWNGLPFTVGLKEQRPASQAFDLRILPLPAGYPMFLESRPVSPISLDQVRIIPKYQLLLSQP